MKILLPLLLIYCLLGCAGDRFHREGLDLLDEGKSEEGLSALAKAVSEEPGNAQFRADFLTRRTSHVNQLLSAAQAQRQGGRLAEAEETYKRVLGIDNTNVRARTGLDELVRDRRHGDFVSSANEAFKAGDLDKAESILRPVLMESPNNSVALGMKRDIDDLRIRNQVAEPILKPGSSKPINLELKEANIRIAFEGLARSSGINFILDKDVRQDLRTTVFLKNTSIEDAIDLILQTSQLQKKVLSSNVVLIYPNNPEKLKEYQDLVMKSFYLQNADVKQVQNNLKTMLKTKDIYIDEKLNLLIMRDTPEAIRLAEKLVAMQDIAEPEVMLEVEVLEVQRSRLTNLGIQWPTQLTVTPLGSGSGSLTVDDLRNMNSKNLGAAISSTIINLQRDITDANILANPRIRVRNRETAKILIGDRVPVVTTTTTTVGVSDSVQYLDVGLKVEAQPDIHLQDDVAIKVNLEVSSIVREVTSKNGTTSYQIGTRNASTVLRLKDGETQILAGLISDNERASSSGIPGLGDFPVLGRLFSGRQDNRSKTEIVLSITPRLIRNIVRPDARAGEFWSGTESTLRTKPLSLQPVAQKKADAASPALKTDSASPETAEASDPSVSVGPATSIALSWQGPHQVKVGEQIKLLLRMKSNGSLRSLPFQAAFDSNAFQVVRIDEGDFFKQGGGSTTLSSNVDAANGKVFVSVIRNEIDGAYGDDLVATIVLRAVAPSPQTTIKMLIATPLVQSDKSPEVLLPLPYGVVISE